MFHPIRHIKVRLYAKNIEQGQQSKRKEDYLKQVSEGALKVSPQILERARTTLEYKTVADDLLNQLETAAKRLSIPYHPHSFVSFGIGNFEFGRQRIISLIKKANEQNALRLVGIILIKTLEKVSSIDKKAALSVTKNTLSCLERNIPLLAASSLDIDDLISLLIKVVERTDVWANLGIAVAMQLLNRKFTAEQILALIAKSRNLAMRKVTLESSFVNPASFFCFCVRHYLLKMIDLHKREPFEISFEQYQEKVTALY